MKTQSQRRLPPLTKRQKQILDFIISGIIQDHCAPTIEEIANHFNVYPNAIQETVEAICKKGYLIRNKHKLTVVGMVLTAMFSASIWGES